MMIVPLIWCSILIDFILCAKLMNCPKINIHFEKVLGIRPVDEIGSLLLYKDDTYKPVTQECIMRCSANDGCLSFIIHYNSSSCYWYKNDFQDAQEEDLTLDIETSWFIKTCYEAGDCTKLWTMERIPGAVLIGNDTKILPDMITRTECEQYCLSETEFQCRSAKFKIKYSNYGPNGMVTGACILSDADRHLLPNSYRVSSYDDEYFENQCVPNNPTDIRDSQQEFCAYEEFVNVTLRQQDILYERSNKEDCKNACESLRLFNCRGFSLIEETSNNINCYLHSADSKIHGPRLLDDNPFGNYYEKALCLNIAVACTENNMVVTYKPKNNFMGKIYMKGYSDQPECFAKGFELNPVILKLPLITSQCGISKANGNYNRTLLSGTMILQHNAFIQTQADRVIRVGCIFGNESKVILGTGVSFPDTSPNQGSALLNSSSSLSPPVSMRVIDLQTQREVSDTQIGQELELIIELEQPQGEFDIWAGHLVAMTENSEESILLLDERGCPTNLNVFPALDKIYTNTTKRLTAIFQAFKFSSSPIVRFSVIVQFCNVRCPSVDCGDGVQSYGRKKRELVTRSIETINGTTIVKVNRTQFEQPTYAVQQMPLEVVMIVRGPRIMPDKLIYGEHNNKILVAGYDVSTNQVCFDYSLLIGLIITWVLIQIIFVVSCVILVRRYKRHYRDEFMRQSMEELHKNFGIGFSNLENRRVHWADNGDFT